MSIFDEINAIPLDTILTTLGIHTKNVMGTLYLFENGKPTDGWKGNLEEGNVSDFAGKRAYGDRITFVMRHLGLDK